MIRLVPGKSGFLADRDQLGAATDPSTAAVVFISTGTSFANRVELAQELGLVAAFDDERLLLAAWGRWREAMVDRLRGAFAFGIYDPDDATFFLARDIFGQMPVFFHVDKNCVVVASSSRLARAIAPTSFSLDPRMCADFIHGIFVEPTNSFFLGLERLPPAHWMKIGRDAVQVERYWSASDVERRAAAPDAPERFREIFDRSVDRADSGRGAALMLSGGLDSSAILGSIMAQKMRDAPPTCLSKTYRQSDHWVDAPYLDLLQRRFDLPLVEVASDRHDPLADMEFWLDVLDGPYVSYGHSVASHLLNVARDLGHDTVLSGHGGDEIVGYGMGRINELAQQRRWIRLWVEAKGMVGLSGQTRLRVLRKYLTHYPRYRAVERRIQHRFPDHHDNEAASLPDALVASLGSDRYVLKSALDRIDHDERMIHVEALENPVQPLALETIGQCSRAVGVETGMPFYDRDLVELTLSLPSEWKLRNGFSRYVLRRAMTGRLPDKIVRRRDKFDFTDAFVAGLVANRHKVLALVANAERSLSGYVNLSRLSAVRNLLSVSPTTLSGADARFIWRCAVFAMWLDRVEFRPAQVALEPITGRLRT